MDRLIRRFNRRIKGDLSVTEKGIAYQTDMSKSVPYDDAYFAKVAAYDGTDIGIALNDGRIKWVERFYKGNVLDIGIGSGEFIRRRPETFGIDVNEAALRWLRHTNKLAEGWEYGAFTMWDSLEHVNTPEVYLSRMKRNSWLFVSMPIMQDIYRTQESKHYRPDEHYYYFTDQGLIFWLGLYGFRMVKKSDFETKAGREAIWTYAFKRDLPLSRETIIQYEKLHEGKYGSSSTLYLKEITEEVKKLNPASILDYGCGQSDLVSYFYLDGARKLGRYDPAVRAYRERPEPGWELVICNDVMEHIPMCDVDGVFKDIKKLGKRALFTISMIPARAELPDGRNAHITLLDADEWTRWVKDYFGTARRIGLQWDHILMLATW